MNTNINQEVADLIYQHFNLNEWEDLCFSLSIESEDIPGDTIRENSRELVKYCQRRDQLSALINTCRKRRPNVSWPNLEDAYASARETNISPSPTVLIIEDEEDWQNILIEILEENDYHCHTAGDYTSAARSLRSLSPQPDAIILDLNLHGVSGLELSSQAHQKQIPIIVVTGAEGATSINDAIDNKVAAYFPKYELAASECSQQQFLKKLANAIYANESKA